MKNSDDYQKLCGALNLSKCYICSNKHKDCLLQCLSIVEGITCCSKRAEFLSCEFRGEEQVLPSLTSQKCLAVIEYLMRNYKFSHFYKNKKFELILDKDNEVHAEDENFLEAILKFLMALLQKGENLDEMCRIVGG